jgi:hypothetical protein
MRRVEDSREFLPNIAAVAAQEFLNERMRTVLVDWLIHLHMNFRMTPETLFIAVNILDRFLALRQVVRQRLQLVGVTAMYIACKY